MSRSRFGRVQAWVIFLNNWVSRPPVFTSKPVTGFKIVSRCVINIALHHLEHLVDISLGHDIIWTTT